MYAQQHTSQGTWYSLLAHLIQGDVQFRKALSLPGEEALGVIPFLTPPYLRVYQFRSANTHSCLLCSVSQLSFVEAPALLPPEVSLGYAILGPS